MIKVEKRDGSKVEYDAAKIKQSINHAVGGTNVNSLALESMIDAVIKNGVKTSVLQENIIHQAVKLASPQNPEWLKVAGRAYAANMWANFKLKGKSFLEIVKFNVKKKEYSESLLKYYTEDQIKELGEYIVQERDLLHSYASLLTVEKKYLGKYELNQHMHMVNAMRFGEVEKASDRIEFVKKIYDALSLRKLSLATPFMSNLRKGGNVASCFILCLEDNIDSIFDNVKRMAKISKNGGGIGVFLGYLRAKGSSVAGYENAAGVVNQWVKIINDTMVAVNQNGKRAGAATVALPIWHNDIQEFLDMQTEHGDLRLKAYDVFPQVTVPDVFMKRDEEQKPWVTFCPFEVREKLGIDIRGLYCEEFEEAYSKIEKAFYEGKLKVAKEIPNARDLTKIIMRCHFDSGLPYMFFVDEANRCNPNKRHKDSYGIVCANLCIESFSNVMPDKLGHVCNLASINLANIDNLEELAYISRLTTRMLDYGIELTNSPDQITEDHNQEFRTIGIGIMGLNDYLAKNKLTYHNLKAIRNLSETVEYNAALESVELAKVFNVFDAFNESEWANGNQTSRFASLSNTPEKWFELQTLINQYGIRNSQLTSPAPTTSTSIYQEASATFLPVFEKFFAEDNKNGTMAVAAKFLKEFPEGYSRDLHEFDALEIIDVASELQKFIDTGISMELLFDQNKPNFKAKDLYDAIHYAHKKKCKAIYYIRSIKKNANIERPEVACESCAS